MFSSKVKLQKSELLDSYSLVLHACVECVEMCWTTGNGRAGNALLSAVGSWRDVTWRADNAAV